MDPKRMASEESIVRREALSLLWEQYYGDNGGLLDRLPTSSWGARPIGAIELYGKVFVELRTIVEKATPQFVEHFDREPLGVCSGLHQDREHSGDRTEAATRFVP
jgi:hypothetical protein